MAGKKIPLEQRLAERTTRIGDCLVWRGSVTRDGYPMMTFGHGKTCRGNRAVWQHFRGDIPAGMLVCHTCDNRLCVNIDHFFLGTPRDNTLDMIRKGRKGYTGGERHGCVKLTDDQVEIIRAERIKGRSLTNLAAEFGVSFQHVGLICQMKTRKERTRLCA